MSVQKGRGIPLPYAKEGLEFGRMMCEGLALGISQPALREKIEVPFYNGSEHVRVSVYKDDWMKEFNKERGVQIGLTDSGND